MLRMIVRFVVSAFVLLFVGSIVPGFSVAGFIGAIIAAVIIALLGYAIEDMFRREPSRLGRGSIGFFTAAVVIYLTQNIIPEYIHASVIGALLGSLVIGVVDSLIPTTLR